MKRAVIGLGFGDEGKGIVTDYLCSQTENPMVVRFSGGQQAGHTVNHNGIRHTFSNFGSGTLRGVKTFWSKHCTMDPVGIMNEHSALDIDLEGRNIPTLYIDPESPVTTPFDKYATRGGKYLVNGTCGVGVGATWKREESHYHLRYKDLFSKTILKIKLNMIQKYYDPLELSEDEADDVEEFMRACGFVTAFCPIGSFESIDSDIIFEGSQGLLLDQDIGFFPHVTRGNVGTKNILKLHGNPYPNISLCLVTRAYQTRHGNGPMTNDNRLGINPGPDENNKSSGVQGNFRISTLDLDLLKYAIISDDYIRINNKNLFITCLDHVVDKWAYTYNGTYYPCKSEDHFVNGIKELLNVSRVIRIRSPRTEDVVE